jgi:hypothetical protein
MGAIKQRESITIKYCDHAQRMTSAELLKYRNGLLMAQDYHRSLRREHLV